MGKFIFRLQSFLGVKEKMEEQKKLEYGRALKKLEEDNQYLESLKMEKVLHMDEFKDSIERKINTSEFKIYNDYIEIIKKRINAQYKVIKQTEQIVERRRLELVEAIKERKMLEALKEKHHEQFLKDELMAEQKLVDEIVSYRYHS